MPLRHQTASKRNRTAARTRALATAAGLLSCLTLAGCFSNNPNAVKEHTADITAAAKHNAGQIAAGVFEGLVRRGPLDLNSARAKDFERLPGITPALSRAIVAGRPYDKPTDLVSKGVLTRAQFNRIKAQVAVKVKPAQP